MQNSSNLPRYIQLVLFGCFINCLFSFAFPMMSLIISSGNKDALEYLPWMMSAAYLFSALLQPRVGTLLDHGSTPVIVKTAALLACSGMITLFLFESQLMAVVLSLGVIVLGLSILSAVGSRAVEGQVEPELRGKTSLLLSGLGNLGFGFSALLAYFFLTRFKGAMLLLDGISTLIYAVILLKLEQRKVTSHQQKEVVGEPRVVGPMRLTIEQLFVLTGVLFFFVAMVSPFSIVPLQYQILGLDFEHLTPVMFGVNNIVVFLTSILILNKVSKLSIFSLSLSSALFLGVGLSLVPMVKNQGENIFVTMLWSIGEVLAYPVIARTVFESFPKGNEGRAAGYKVAMLRLAFVLAPAFVGLIRWSGSWVFSITFGTIPLLGFFLIWNRFGSEQENLQVVKQT